jgi:hypothetical protein
VAGLVEKVQYQGKLVKVVIAFDVDGTLETSAGPVKIDRMNDLIKAGVDVWIVSPSGLSPNRRTTEPTNFPEVINGDRLANLNKVKESYGAGAVAQWLNGAPFLFLYVSDNKDYDIAKQAGFSYIEAQQFY